MPAIIFLLFAILIVLIGGPLLLFGVIAVPGYLFWASGVIQFVVWCFLLMAGAALAWLIKGFVSDLRHRAPQMLDKDGSYSPAYLAEMQQRTEEYKRKNGLA
ncbi:hypothetical protein [Rhizobium sp. TRM95796]|uniref:hypothetical protein n=1 Tax=Rhizobium sp. TRM95796 TaxID=2979862 RepID=UPI0021E88D18|nr:hypothetical protein [Rhizobium sp. TRM95796]MCV3766469.1 hypothetical protein [Rhizobium sp. TRM95796]